MTRTRLEDMGFDVMVSNLGIRRDRDPEVERRKRSSGNVALAVWHISKRCAAVSRFRIADPDGETNLVEGRDCVKGREQGRFSLSYSIIRGVCHHQCLSWPTLTHTATRTHVCTGLQCIYINNDLTYRHTFTSIVLSLADLVLPPAFLLRCLSSTSLKCLIPFRCVFSDWGRLVLRSDLHPTRPRFLELHDKMLANPLFPSSAQVARSSIFRL